MKGRPFHIKRVWEKTRCTVEDSKKKLRLIKSLLEFLLSHIQWLSSSGRDRECKGIRRDAGLVLVCHKRSELLRSVFARQLACITTAVIQVECCVHQCNVDVPHCILVWWCMKDVVVSSSSLSESVLQVSQSSSSSSSSSSVTSSADWSSGKL